MPSVCILSFLWLVIHSAYSIGAVGATAHLPCHSIFLGPGKPRLVLT